MKPLYQYTEEEKQELLSKFSKYLEEKIIGRAITPNFEFELKYLTDNWLSEPP